MLHALLSLDFIGAEEMHPDFYSFLVSKNWYKLTGVDTVWKFRFDKYTQLNQNSVEKYIKGILIDAAEKFEPIQITYVVQIGNAAPLARQVSKRFGAYMEGELT